MSIAAHRCQSQYHGHGCGRPAGHVGEHYTADQMAGWTTRVETQHSTWSECGDEHPTAGFRCGMVRGHAGKHYVATEAPCAAEPTCVRARPIVAWITPRKRRPTAGALGTGGGAS